MGQAYFRQWEPLLPPGGQATGPLVVVSPHPDDEVIGAGGLILGNRLAEEEVSVVVLTDGRQGDPGGDKSDSYVRQREAECLAAGAVLGTNRTEFLRLPDGELAARHQSDFETLASTLMNALSNIEFSTLALPSPFELHPDHKAAFLIGFEAWCRRGRKEKLILYEVGSLMPCNFLLDVTAVADQKDKALACYASQLAHHDITAKVKALDVARCANIPDAAVSRCEGYIEVTAESADEFRRLADELLIVTDAMKPGRVDE